MVAVLQQTARCHSSNTVARTFLNRYSPTGCCNGSYNDDEEDKEDGDHGDMEIMMMIMMMVVMEFVVVMETMVLIMIWSLTGYLKILSQNNRQSLIGSLYVVMTNVQMDSKEDTLMYDPATHPVLQQDHSRATNCVHTWSLKSLSMLKQNWSMSITMREEQDGQEAFSGGMLSWSNSVKLDNCP